MILWNSRCCSSQEGMTCPSSNPQPCDLDKYRDDLHTDTGELEVSVDGFERRLALSLSQEKIGRRALEQAFENPFGIDIGGR